MESFYLITQTQLHVSVCNFSFVPPLSNLTKSAFVYLLLQSKVSQPKDDDVSDCAKNGYAGIKFLIYSKPEFLFYCFT